MNDIECAKLIKYNRGLGSALDCLQNDAHVMMTDALRGTTGNKPPLRTRDKRFCLTTTCACNGPATPSPGTYLCMRCCNNPCCCAPVKYIYCPPVPDGACRVKTDFFYLKQMPQGTRDHNGKEQFNYTHDSGTVELCRPRNSFGEWTRSCGYYCH